ncbi:MAG: hypothetical protein KGM42_21425, partial [Hyphomicrobiales bacterium]|nr:hypothetical protein [Hyphomicrobiales bacterium]
MGQEHGPRDGFLSRLSFLVVRSNPFADFWRSGRISRREAGAPLSDARTSYPTLWSLLRGLRFETRGDYRPGSILDRT